MIPALAPPRGHSAAETRVWEQLRDDPDTKDWVVFHSLGLMKHVSQRYGEIDFVVIVPAVGVFCLEIKGGRIACQNGVWSSKDGEDRVHILPKSPFDQAQNAMFSLQKWIREEIEDGDRLANLVFASGCVFPNIVWEHQSPEYQSWQVFDRSFVRSIAFWIRQLGRLCPDAQLPGGRSKPRPTPHDVALLKRALRPDFDYGVKVAHEMEAVEERLARLTQEQLEALEGLSRVPRVCVEGAAGTGKTLVALEHARRAALRGERVLFTCFNRFLGNHLRSQVQNAPEWKEARQNVVVGSFHRVLDDIIARTPLAAKWAALRQEPRSGAALDDFFRNDYTDWTLRALESSDIRPFDRLVVDEAQDLISEEWLVVFDALLLGGLPGGNWTMFGDFNRQAIYAGVGDGIARRRLLDDFAPSVPYELRWNCRNPRRIARETSFLSGFETPPFRVSAEEGAPVNYVYFRDELEERLKIETWLLRLTREEGFAPDEITILSSRRVANGALRALVSPSSGQINDASWPARDHPLRVAEVSEESVEVGRARDQLVRWATFGAFKGLENRAILVSGVSSLESDADRQLLYVGMSRARSRLVVVLPKGLENAKNLLEFAALERGNLA